MTVDLEFDVCFDPVVVRDEEWLDDLSTDGKMFSELSRRGREEKIRAAVDQIQRDILKAMLENHRG